MIIRKVTRRIVNTIGYDIHRVVTSSTPCFDPAQAHFATATLEKVTARFFVADPLDTIQSQHSMGCFFETDILSEIAAHFAPNGCYVDIGANVGNHLIYIAQRFPEAHLIAFEPMRRQHAILVVNTLLNEVGRRLVIYKSAASDHRGKAQMITPFSGNLGRSMIADVGYGEWVDLHPADDVLADQQVSFVKIDVEGHELSTLAGLEQTVRRCRPTLLVEVNETNRDGFEAWRKCMGYRVAKYFKHNDENFEVLAVSE